jgi:protocatechuate 3,4-dioxygenase beta subunit
MNICRKFIVLILLAFAAGGALAQKKGREPELRTVHGTVVDKQETPIESAVVYLKNAHTQDVKTYISDNQGEYRFSGLDPNIDYEIHAEREGLTSATHSISSFDTRKDVSMTLKVDRKKSDK